ncbi:MAG: ABC transporter ATP-binding protein [Sulfobacillus sp.]|nr:ABC transporter ATP-binding protein [Sulfobacillus sp.]
MANQPGPLIEVVNAGKSYRGVPVVHAISFHVNAGEVVGLIGPNGAGKTTTLRMVTGLVAPSVGTVRLDGHSVVSERGPALKALGTIMEESRFYRYLTGLDNLRQVARMRGLATERSSLLGYLEEVGLLQAADRPVREYSLGMRQRLALAVALLVRPKILVLDEPMNGLDPGAIKDLRDRLRQLAADGLAVLLSSHLLSEVEHVCDRVLLLAGGRLLGEEPLRDPRRANRPVWLQVEPIDRATVLLREAGWRTERQDQGLVVYVGPDEVPQVIRHLVHHDVAILAVVPDRGGLEARYLARTGANREVMG